MPTPVATSPKYLDIAVPGYPSGFALFCASWFHETLAPIERRLNVRGEDIPLPGSSAAGVYPTPRRPMASRRTLPMRFFGDKDCEGTPWPDPAAGLEQNLDLFMEAVVDPFQTGALYLAAATIHRFDGSTATAEIRVVDFEWSLLDDDVAVGTLDLELPSGAFELVAS